MSDTQRPGARPADRARVTTFVAVEPALAFEAFTGETDPWWRRGRRYRFGEGRDGDLRFEGGAGGRLVETFDNGARFEVGRDDLQRGEGRQGGSSKVSSKAL